MMEGRVHLINQSTQNLSVELSFPSGAVIRTLIPKDGAQDFRVENTGEGSIQVSINKKSVGGIGYVTSMNGLIVVAVGESRAVVSSVFPDLEAD